MAAVVALGIDGLCKADAKPFGPVHAYVAPDTVGVVRFSVLPAQTGLLLDAVGVAGLALTTTLVVPAGEVHPPTVTFTLYVPVAAVGALGMDGFCTVDEKPFGPFQE